MKIAKGLFALFLLFSGPYVAHADASKVVLEETLVKTQEPGVEIYVRNKHLDGLVSHSADRTLIFVHGATYPAETSFDLPIDGQSMMDLFASQGFDVYLVDLFGYGRSSRPPEMDQPPEKNKPITDSEEANRDLGAAIDYILSSRGIPKLNLMGWSWGTSVAGNYASQHNDRINRLVLYAPAWLFQPAKEPPTDPLPAYRLVTKEMAKTRWYTGVPLDKQATLIAPGLFDRWWDETLATDPAGEKTTPPSLRAPNGVIKEFGNYWRAGKPFYDPATIAVPTLVVHAEWDADLPSYMALAYFSKLSSAPYKRFIEIGEGTHSVMLEKNRMQFFREILNFLSEP
jgi:pimeloyl-ACP methyl ester carboxylesterase